MPVAAMDEAIRPTTAVATIGTGFLSLQRKERRVGLSLSRPLGWRAVRFDRVVWSRNIVTRCSRSRLVPAGPTTRELEGAARSLSAIGSWSCFSAATTEEFLKSLSGTLRQQGTGL